MKTLFIIHSTNMIYGAAKSLSTVTRNWEDEFDIVLPKDFPRDAFRKDNRFSEVDFRNFYGKNLRNIYFMWMPFVFPLDVEYKKTIKWKIKYGITYVLGKIFQAKLYQMIRRNQYDIVHLNSLILFPLLTRKYHMYIHVREVSNAGRVLKGHILKKFRNAKGVIFIDNATVKPFSDKMSGISSIVLNNPFDMRGIEKLNKESIRQQYDIDEDEIVYTIAGNVSEVKGVDFVVKSFVKTDIRAKLLVIGSGEKEFLEKCQRIVASDSRVAFIGELTDMQPIYAISDYIVRGDANFCIGRTIYEGLYAGASVIMPGEIENGRDVFEYEKFRDRILFYIPRNEVTLQTVLKNCTKIDKDTRVGMSNAANYLVEFNKFIAKDGK